MYFGTSERAKVGRQHSSSTVRCTRSTQPLVWGELSNALVFLAHRGMGACVWCMSCAVPTFIFLTSRCEPSSGSERSVGLPSRSSSGRRWPAWLRAKRVRVVAEDEWRRRFRSLLQRRRKVAASLKLGEDEVQADVARAIADVRRTRTARRR